MTSGFRIPSRGYKLPKIKSYNPYSKPVIPRHKTSALPHVDGKIRISGRIYPEQLEKLTGWMTRIEYRNRNRKETKITGEITGILNGKLNIQMKSKKIRHIPLLQIQTVILL